jgi:hypothetical protein
MKLGATTAERNLSGVRRGASGNVITGKAARSGSRYGSFRCRPSVAGAQRGGNDGSIRRHKGRSLLSRPDEVSGPAVVRDRMSPRSSRRGQPGRCSTLVQSRDAPHTNRLSTPRRCPPCRTDQSCWVDRSRPGRCADGRRMRSWAKETRLLKTLPCARDRAPPPVPSSRPCLPGHRAPRIPIGLRSAFRGRTSAHRLAHLQTRHGRPDDPHGP